jgi:hypothetical protein
MQATTILGTTRSEALLPLTAVPTVQDGYSTLQTCPILRATTLRCEPAPSGQLDGPRIEAR